MWGLLGSSISAAVWFSIMITNTWSMWGKVPLLATAGAPAAAAPVIAPVAAIAIANPAATPAA